MPVFDEANFTFKHAFEQDKELKKYGDQSLLVFGLALYLEVEDFDELAAEAITDGPDDKKVDACYIDLDGRVAVVAQGYLSKHWGKAAAHANKASDLNTAMSWLLAARIEDVPSPIRTKATELRTAIAQKEIDSVHLVYVHNCFQSDNVRQELAVAAKATKGYLQSLKADQIAVTFEELGLESIQDLFRSKDPGHEILVTDELNVPGTVLQKEPGKEWKAVVLSVGGDWIQDLYLKHGNRLFSANFRDFLGMSKRRGNINAGIRQTAASEPANFWVYNNGITALTHEITLKGKTIKIKGISIINGAQTSGSIGDCEPAEARAARVLCRLVECAKPEIIQKIIRYNNTQNEIRPADTRSNDDRQRALRRAFAAYKITYIHRRTEVRAPHDSLSAETVGPALCAFHGDSQTAARNRSQIFDSDATYNRVFPPNLSAEHIFLVTSLSSAIDHLKWDLKEKVSSEKATGLQFQEYEVLKYSMSKFFILFIVGALAEELVNGKVADLYQWKVTPKEMKPDSKKMDVCWGTVFKAILPLIANVTSKHGTAYDVTRAKGAAEKVAADMKAMLASLEQSLGKQLECLRKATTW